MDCRTGPVERLRRSEADIASLRPKRCSVVEVDTSRRPPNGQAKCFFMAIFITPRAITGSCLCADNATRAPGHGCASLAGFSRQRLGVACGGAANGWLL